MSKIKNNENGALLRTLSGIFLVTIGMQVFIIQPGLLAVLQQSFNLTNAAVGYLASAEMFGIAIATLGVPAVMRRVSARGLTGAALLLLAAADAASAATVRDWLLALRFCAGIGAGVLISIGYAMVGLSRTPARHFGVLIMVVLGYGALGIFALPAISLHFGVEGILFGLTAFALSGIFVLVHVVLPHDSTRWPRVATARKLMLAKLLAVFTYFLGQGVVWPYLSVVGSYFGISDQSVATSLTLSQLAGMVGALFTAILGGRGNTRLLVIAGGLGTMLPILAFIVPQSSLGFGLLVSLFNLSANLMTALLIAIVADADASGIVVQRAAALQMVGLAVGPAMAGYLIGDAQFNFAFVLAGVFFGLSMLCSIVDFAGVVDKCATEPANQLD